MKKCKKCLLIKEINLFYKNNSICKDCHKLNMNEYRKTKDGVSTSIYNTQCKNSVIRGHDKPKYTKEEFSFWLFNHKKFNILFNDWVNSGYKKNLKPSPDRINNDIGYSFDNLRLGTCIENLRNKRIEFKKKDYELIFIPKYRIKGFENYYFTTEGKLFNIKTNRFSKKVVKSSSVGYNINGAFVLDKNIERVKVRNLSNNIKTYKTDLGNFLNTFN